MASSSSDNLYVVLNFILYFRNKAIIW